MTRGPVEHLFTLHRSPIALAPVIHQFFASSQPRERDFLLSYLVLPMVLYPAMQEYLLTVRKTSNLRTLCKEQSRLVGLTRNAQQFKPLTHAAMLVLKAEGKIEITDGLTVKTAGDVTTDNANPNQLEAARRLSIIFAEVDIVSIYRTLGFKSL
ncbi:three component ABC system middle component [Massilia niastensis]|uniref:three component ABC system middle component n=1 Tax=Massilia niastensis TaxID=544911 RepID=UPI000A059128|nr:three component ABC system middle component [Massilia niastensis]